MNRLIFLKNKKSIVKVLLLYCFIQIVTYSLLLYSNINELYDYSRKTSSRILTNKIALNLGTIIDDSFLMKLYILCMFLLVLLPAPLFYQYYMGGKSIYTLLRLPRRKARLLLYLEQVLPSMIGMLLLWFLQFLLILLFYLAYVVLVPIDNQPHDIWGTLWSGIIIGNLYPIMNPVRFLVVISLGLLLPSLTMLLVLAERSRKQSIAAIVASVIALYGIYELIGSNGYYEFIVLPIITVFIIGMGLFYMYRKQIL